MTVATAPAARNSKQAGARLHRLSVREYLRMVESGIFRPNDPIEMIEGLLVIKGGIAPPYGVPVGIPPPEILAEHERWGPHPLRRLTVEEYERIVDEGLLNAEKRHELIEGWIVDKMTHQPRQDHALYCVQSAILEVLPKAWCLRIQSAIALDESLPEPDFTIVQGPHDAYRTRHSNPSEVELLIEVSDSSLALDIGPKLRSYARNAVARYWVADMRRECVHVFDEPSGPTDAPAYARRAVLRKDQAVPLMLRDKLVARIRVRDLLGSGQRASHDRAPRIVMPAARELRQRGSRISPAPVRMTEVSHWSSVGCLRRVADHRRAGDATVGDAMATTDWPAALYSIKRGGRRRMTLM